MVSFSFNIKSNDFFLYFQENNNEEQWHYQTKELGNEGKVILDRS